MTKVLLPGKTIGIIGAGQLGKMLAQAAQKMGYRVHMYDPNPSSCGFKVSHDYTVAPFDDRQALMAFADKVDVITYEFENIDGDLLVELEENYYLPQGSNLLLVSQHRVKEKEWLQSIGVPTVDFQLVETIEDLKKALDKQGYPGVLKTTRFGYDGKGQVLIKKAQDLSDKQEEIEDILQTLCVLEAFCPFEYEASVMVSRDLHGKVYVFPTSINEHKNGILYSSLVGEKISPSIQTEIERIAKTIATEGSLVGVCGVEFFVTKEGEVLVNEIAPRPHNSGHYSIEACNVSQYDQHILAITGRTIIEPRLFESALMINILGQHITDLSAMMATYPQAIYHLYDKGEAKAQRKMGHFTLTDPDLEKVRTMLTQSDVLAKWKAKF